MSASHDPECNAQTSYHGLCTCRPTRPPYREPTSSLRAPRPVPLTSLKQLRHAPDCLAASNSSFACTCDPTEESLLIQASRPSPAELIRRAKAKGLFTAKPEYSFKP